MLERVDFSVERFDPHESCGNEKLRPPNTTDNATARESTSSLYFSLEEYFIINLAVGYPRSA